MEKYKNVFRCGVLNLGRIGWEIRKTCPNKTLRRFEKNFILFRQAQGQISIHQALLF